MAMAIASGTRNVRRARALLLFAIRGRRIDEDAYQYDDECTYGYRSMER